MMTLYEKIKATFPHAAEDFITKQAAALSAIVPELQTNLNEWINDEPFSDIWIRGKYTLRTVLELRGNGNVAAALLALNRYARDAKQEAFLLLRRL